MLRLRFNDLTSPSLRTLVHLEERGVVPAYWDTLDALITPTDQQQLRVIISHYLNYEFTLMNEATIWSRAIYPMLLLAERYPFLAWAQVTLRATYPQFELEGLADGVIGNAISATIEPPYFIVLEAKRGVDAPNPQYQLYGALMAAAWQNRPYFLTDQQEVYGCYTVGDNWTFVHATVADFETDRPQLVVQRSREYTQRYDAENILRILKNIVARFTLQASVPRQAA